MEVEWTLKMVADRMEEAASTLRRLPMAGVKPREYGNSWPSVIHDAKEAYGWNDAVVRIGQPSAEAITRMDEVMEWLRWLNQEQVKLVWLRATRIPWKLIEVRFAYDRSTAWRKWNIALNCIASRLKSRHNPMLQQKRTRQLQQNLLF
ncbi:MAG: hypothetical protein HQL07_00525 [Nitrospirae bacterium]|nr:hypothetical protein [Magnetococcales bacterium]